MLPCCSTISNHKILKIEGGDDVGSRTGGDSSETETRGASSASDCGDDSSSSLARVQANPLQNRVILNHLFQLCPTDVLATCRLVCKQWYEESLLTWRNSSPLRFTFEEYSIREDWNIYLECVTPCVQYHGVWPPGKLPLQKFLEYAADPTTQLHSKPYRYIRIRDSRIAKIGPYVQNKKQFEIFWNALVCNLTTLELSRCTFSNVREFRRIIFTLCPNLKRLIIDSCKFPQTRNVSLEGLDLLDYMVQPSAQNEHLKVLQIKGGWKRETKLPVSWLELFTHFPLMSSLTLPPLKSDTDELLLPVAEFEALIKAIRIIRKRDGRLLPFKVLEIGTLRISSQPSTKQTLTIFRELHLPLQKLFFKLRPGIDDDIFRDAFASCAKTMKSIHMIEYVSTQSFSEFPFGNQLDNLSDLLIECSFTKNMTFLKYMPNLEYLHISYGERNLMKPFRPRILTISIPEPTHLKMIKLTRLGLYHYQVEDDDIAKLPDLMPNVTFLTIILNDKQFGIVCKKWRNLKEFRVFGDALTDEGVTGKKHNMEGANITNLQNLEEFSFESNKLTFKSVFDGFMQLPKLRLLVNLSSKPVRWRSRATQALRDRNIQLYNWDEWCLVNGNNGRR